MEPFKEEIPNMENNDNHWKPVHHFQTSHHIFYFHPKQAFRKPSPRRGEHKFLCSLLAWGHAMQWLHSYLPNVEPALGIVETLCGRECDPSRGTLPPGPQPVINSRWYWGSLEELFWSWNWNGNGCGPRTCLQIIIEYESTTDCFWRSSQHLYIILDSHRPGLV